MMKRILRAASICVCLAQVSRAENIRFISHRGESYDAPENTMAAFQLAVDRQTAGFECDVYLTADNEIVCMHDATTTRTTDGSLTVAGTFKGFKTGEQGMGHVLLMVTDMAAADEFYRSVLGFQLSDRIVQPPALDALFYHVNGRHHTLALAEAPFCGLNHLMIETVSLDTSTKPPRTSNSLTLPSAR